jgi:probable HAF family extracellular repeat protein
MARKSPTAREDIRALISGVRAVVCGHRIKGVFPMTRTNLKTHAVLAMIISTAAIPFAANAQTVFPRARNYEVHELTLNGIGCRVNDIDRGMAAGWCGTDPMRAFAWTEAMGVIDLGTLGGTSAFAIGTRNGRAVGASTISGDLTQHAFAWSLPTGMIDLGSLGGPLISGHALSGQFVVGAGTLDEQGRAFRWSPSTGMVALPLLPGGAQNHAFDIDGDLIAGYSATSIPGTRPIIWRTDGTLIDPLGDPIESCGIFVCGDGIATAVRDGLVVGYRRNAEELSRAFAWTQASGLIDLGLVPGSTESFALDTDERLVVGQLSGPLSTRAFGWTAARGMRAITPTTVTAVATSVTNGRVVGWYHSADTNGVRIFMWTAERGLVDVTPRGFNGSRPAGIDAQGRIAVAYEDENPLNTRSVVLVPRDL